MPRLVRRRLPLVALLLLAAASTGRADPIQWSYSTFIFPGFVRPDVGPVILPYPYPYPGNVGVAFQGTSADAADTTPVVLANLWATGWLAPGESATFKRQPINLGMGILDKKSNRSKVAVFTAFLDGTVTDQGSNLRLTFTDKSRAVHIDRYLYTVSIDSIVLPGPLGGGGPIGSTSSVRPYPEGSGYGAIGATVSVRHNPEPSTLLLVGGGGVAAGWYYSRRRVRR